MSRTERRRHPRACTDWPLTIGLADGEHAARLRDVSRAGVSFFLDRRIPEMTVLRLALDLPRDGGGSEHIVGSGVVVRCQPIGPHVDHFEVAVFLNDLEEGARDRLASCVASALR